MVRTRSTATRTALGIGLVVVALGLLGVLVLVASPTLRARVHRRLSAELHHRGPAKGSTTITAAGVPFHAIVRGPSVSRAPKVVLFLHGGSYTSRIWDDRGILDAVAAKGFRVVAVDLPGAGDTPARPAEGPESTVTNGTVLRALIEAVGGPAKVVVVSPSASGAYSLPELQQYPEDRLAGFVPVAPVGADAFDRPTTAVRIPAIVVQGANDDVIPRAQMTELVRKLPGSHLVVIPGAGHAAYDDHPEAFTRVLLRFLAGLRS